MPDAVFTVPAPGSYQVLIAFGLRLVDPDMIARLRAFVTGGGVLINGLGVATLDHEHVAPDAPMPWGLTDVLGCERIEFSTLSPSLQPPKEHQGETAATWVALRRQGAVPVPVPVLVLGEGPLSGTFAADIWCDHLEAQGCAVWARFATGSPAAGLPAVTCHAHGAGRTIYVGGPVDDALMDAVVAQATAVDRVAPQSADPWVKILPVADGGKPLWFVLNHGHSAVTMTLPGSCRDLVDAGSDSTVMAPYQVRLFTPAG